MASGLAWAFFRTACHSTSAERRPSIFLCSEATLSARSVFRSSLNCSTFLAVGFITISTVLAKVSTSATATRISVSLSNDRVLGACSWLSLLSFSLTVSLPVNGFISHYGRSGGELERCVAARGLECYGRP